MPLSFFNNVPQASQVVSQTQAAILTNFQSVDSAFNSPTGGVTGGGNFTSYSLQATTTNFTLKPNNPVGVLYTVASTNGNPELAWINNVNSVGAGPYTGTRVTGGGITAAAWCTFSVSGGVVTFNENYNVSGVVRNAQGVFTVSFSRNFTGTYPGTSGYAAIVSPNMQSVNGFAIKVSQFTKNAGSFQFSLQDQGNVFRDPVSCDLVFFGTLV